MKSTNHVQRNQTNRQPRQSAQNKTKTMTFCEYREYGARNAHKRSPPTMMVNKPGTVKRERGGGTSHDARFRSGYTGKISSPFPQVK